MKSYLLTHLADRILLEDLAARIARDRGTTATLLAYIGEVDARKLYLPAAHSSMYSYCTRELRLSEDSAYKRIQAARVARRFPLVFEMIADGRLHLSAVCLLATHLTSGNATELLCAASHKTKSEIEQLLAERFPRTELLEMVEVIPTAVGASGQFAPGQVGSLADTSGVAGTNQLAPGQVHALLEVRPGAGATQMTPGPVAPIAPPTTLKPIASQRFALQVTVGQGTHDKLRYAQSLLRHQIPSGDMAEVLDRALDALITRLEKSKFAATDQPRARRQPPKPGSRHIPAHVKRTVWVRDGGRCTFVSETGRRCEARELLEFDHIEEVARGGTASTNHVRLRCRAHNQYAAEITFGTEFMRHKREDARRAGAERRAAAAKTAATIRLTAETSAAARAAKEPRQERNFSPGS